MRKLIKGSMFLVLIETSGNQNFIFATNKLKENIGASELTYQVTTKWLLNIIGEVIHNDYFRDFGKDSQDEMSQNDRLRKLLLCSKYNPSIEEQQSDDNAVEIVIMVSGKALLITNTEKVAQQIIEKITTIALKNAPGIDISGVYKEFKWDNKIGETVKKVYQLHQVNHSYLPSPEFRFLRLPIIAPCNTSGLPASVLEKKHKNEEAISFISSVKRNSGEGFLDRINEIVSKTNDNGETISLPKSINELEKVFNLSEPKKDYSEDENKISSKIDWLAIVHADGNGLGQILLNFDEFTSDNRDYINILRKFSLALDLCTENAFKQAIKVFDAKKVSKKNSQQEEEYKILPVVPLVLGGDDLTVVCDGRKAIEFTKIFLEEFENQTSKKDLKDVGNIIPIIAEKGLKSKNLSACAGIAIIKPHFPFSVGYNIAESLIKSAKIVKKTVQKENKIPASCSALDFHIVYDSSGIDLDLIRNKLVLNKEKDNKKTVYLYKRPFVVTPRDKLQNITVESNNWVEFYRWEKFHKKVELLTKSKQDFNQLTEIDTEEKGEKTKKKPSLLPNQAHKIRSSLYQGKDAGDAQYQLIKHRYETTVLEEDCEKESLFKETPEDKNIYATSFLDALEAVGFVSIEEKNNSTPSQYQDSYD